MGLNMSLSSLSEEDEPEYFRPHFRTVYRLDLQEVQTINEQMVREIFRMAGRRPTDHAGCFQACIQMVNDTSVIHATDFKKWEGNPRIQAGLDKLELAERSQIWGAIWMINAPVAVATAAALNLPRIRIPKDSRLINAFDKKNLWAWIGHAIDFWSTLPGSIVSTFRHENIVTLMHLRPTIDTGNALDHHTVSLFPSITLPLFVRSRTAEVERSPWAERWLQARMVSTVVTTRREEAMKKGERVLAKLGNGDHDQGSLRDPINEWLNESIIRVLPEDVKEKLLVWSLQHHSHWQTIITQASQDLIEHDQVTCSREIFARLESQTPKGRLDHGRCLVRVLENARSRAAMERLVFLMQKADAREFPVSADDWEAMTCVLEPKPSHMQPLAQSPKSPLFMGPNDGRDRSGLARIMQQVFDASILVTPKCPALVDVWMVLLPMMDCTLLPSICLDGEKAKQRWVLAKRQPWRRVVDDGAFSKMATMVNKADPEGLLVAFMSFLIYMPQILNERDSTLLEHCLQRPEAPKRAVRGQKRSHSQSGERV